jgi:signal transduction histidine kinase
MGWKTQFTAFGVVVFVSSCLLLFLRSQNEINVFNLCRGQPLSSWTNNFLHLYFGGALMMTTMYLGRAAVPFLGFSNGTLRHPYATILTLLISIVNTFSYGAHYFQLYEYTCVNVWGIHTSPFLFFDWLATVPFLLFLTSKLDARQSTATWANLSREFLSFISILFATFTYLPRIPLSIASLLYIISLCSMIGALQWQYLEAKVEYEEARKELPEEVSYQTIDSLATSLYSTTDVYERLCVADCKVSLSIFLIGMFAMFPIVYTLRILGLFQDDVCMIVLFGLSLFTKFFYLQIVGDCHIELLNPHKFQLLEEKKKFVENRSLFLRYVFHEVRVPLNSISLGLQILQDLPHRLNEEIMELITMMKDASRMMEETLNDVLSFQKMEEGKLHLELKPFQPHELINSVVTRFRSQADLKEIVLQVNIDSDLPSTIVGDIFRLDHVLGNLVSNAIKFSDKQSTIEISVTKEKQQDINFIRFAVKDYGIGIAEEDQLLLFQPFRQIRPGELQQGRGSGLGLSMCKALITLHQGIIGVQSKKRAENDPGGSVFYFLIKENPPTNSPRHQSLNLPKLTIKTSHSFTIENEGIPKSPTSLQTMIKERSLSTLSQLNDPVDGTAHMSRDCSIGNFIEQFPTAAVDEANHQLQQHLYQSLH